MTLLTPFLAGGALKLKGSSGITKKKKKTKTKKSTAPATSTPPPDSTAQTDAQQQQLAEEQEEEDLAIHKTDAERRFEERRRRMMDKRLEKEGGGKSHKERVEEYNKYLAGLSEHHDMWVSLVVVWGTCTDVLIGRELDRGNRRRGAWGAGWLYFWVVYVHGCGLFVSFKLICLGPELPAIPENSQEHQRNIRVRRNDIIFL